MSVKKIANQLVLLQTFINKSEFTNDAVSKSSSYWQVSHALKVISGIASVLKNSYPATCKPTWSFLKIFIMTTGYIPRGKARAPKQTVPDGAITQKDLKTLWNETRESVGTLDAIPAHACFEHPVFGWMDKKSTLKFISIHTNHHLKILRDMATN